LVREDVDGGAVVLTGGGACVGAGGVKVNVGADVGEVVIVGDASMPGVKVGIAMSPWDEG